MGTGEFEGGAPVGWALGDVVGVGEGNWVGAGVWLEVDAKAWKMVVAGLSVPSWFINPSSRVKSKSPLLL